jgi:hypothetical protein
MPDLIHHRTAHSKNRWLFYAGDHEIPQDLKSMGVPVMSSGDVFHMSEQVFAPILGNTKLAGVPRDLAAFVDYLICSRMPYFIGNSVSTWSASQILQRDTMATWYNSGFIPMASFIKAYFIPIVYTYTELSSSVGKLFLQASILSVRLHMPDSQIHVLYHGEADRVFRKWLRDHKVIVHDHSPVWKEKVENMRLAKHHTPSHLYAHAGNYFGTWQRIDIPLFVDSEYCLFLDSDAMVAKRFTMDNLGMVITPTLGFASELDENDRLPSNAGVALMNIPFMRETLLDFHTFIFAHENGEFKRGPSDQGAYNDFYEGRLTWLHNRYNMKPYYTIKNDWKFKFILHFHGLKPQDIITYWFKDSCDPLKCYLIFRFRGSPFICSSLQLFGASMMVEGTEIVESFCSLTIPDYSELCLDFFVSLAKKALSVNLKNDVCKDVAQAAVLDNGLDLDKFPNIGVW